MVFSWVSFIACITTVICTISNIYYLRFLHSNSTETNEKCEKQTITLGPLPIKWK